MLIRFTAAALFITLLSLLSLQMVFLSFLERPSLSKLGIT